MSMRIAIVEDTHEVMLVHQLLLHDVDITPFTNGTDALAADWARFDAAIVDVMLGAGPNGVDVARHALTVNPGLRLLLLTALGPAEIPEDLIAHHGTKPMDVPEIRRRLGLDDG